MSSTLVSFHLATCKYLGYNGIDQSMSIMTHHESVITVFLFFSSCEKRKRKKSIYKPKAVKLLIARTTNLLIYHLTLVPKLLDCKYSYHGRC